MSRSRDARKLDVQVARCFISPAKFDVRPMARTTAIGEAMLLAAAILVSSVFYCGIAAAITSVDCVVLIGSNCGDRSQCLNKHFSDGRASKKSLALNFSDENLCRCCATSSAINAKVCVPRDCADDCKTPKPAFICGTDSRPGHCEFAPNLGIDCELDGPAEEVNLCESVSTCQQSPRQD
jgi:hypothetical protein